MSCECDAQLLEKKKLDPKYKKCIFLGYVDSVKGYCLWVLFPTKLLLNNNKKNKNHVRSIMKKLNKQHIGQGNHFGTLIVCMASHDAYYLLLKKKKNL
ncbi:hypothetical protein CR513_59315, partial [Mucuna pruriens]